MPYQQYLRTMGGVLKQQSFVSKLDFDNLLKYLRGETATSKQVRSQKRREHENDRELGVYEVCRHVLSFLFPFCVSCVNRLNKAACFPERPSSSPKQEHSRGPRVATLPQAPRTVSTSI